MAFLEVRNIQKSFGQTEVLKGIDLDLEQGEVLVIIGSSGSGKTTLLRSLNFLELPDAGTMTLNGEILLDASDRTMRSDAEIRKNRLHFGLVFQQFNLFPQYSVLDNLTLSPRLMTKENAKKAKKKPELFPDPIPTRAELEEQAMALLSRVGLAEKATSYPCELSGGQQQRVAIARALALSPDILCFDEPTSALDPELTGEVLKVIRSLKDEKRTMIVVTHEMEFARGVADRVIFMADGVIAESGTPKEIFDHPRTEALQNFLRASKEK